MWVNSRSSLFTQRLSNFVGTAESSTKLPWKSLRKRVGEKWMSQSNARMNRQIGDALDTLQCLVPARNALWNAAVADIISIFVLKGAVIPTRHVHRESLLGTARRGPQKRQVAHVFDVLVRIIIRLK